MPDTTSRIHKNKTWRQILTQITIFIA
jgi:hypothetical protein